MSLYKKYATDKAAEKGGVWYDKKDCPNEDGTIPGFKISRMNARNKEYLKAIEKHTKDGISELIVAGKLSDEEAFEYNVNVFVDGILTDWRHVKDENDENIVERDDMVSFLKSLPDLFDELERFAQRMSNYNEERLKESAKN